MHVQPPFPEFLPEVQYKAPDVFPDLSRAKKLTIDVETRDPELNSKGPGFIRGDAYTVGVAINADDEYIAYYPVRHLTGQNLAPNVVFDWLGDQLKYDSLKIGANLLYDFEALRHEGITKIGGKWCDIQIAEPLLDEDSLDGYSLEVLAQKYLTRSKDEALLRQVSSMHKKGFKGKKGIQFHPKTDLWALDPKYVSAYAMADVMLPSEIIDRQLSQLSSEDLLDIWELERSITPVLLEMRMTGVLVDLEAAHSLANDIRREVNSLALQIRELIGFDVNVDSNKDLKAAYERLSYMREELYIQLKYTEAGNPSFTKEWLDAQDDPLSQLVRKKRKSMTMLNDFVLGDIIGEQVRGRIHAQFHQLRQDDRGTRSGRFSSSNPNLQQVPNRDEEWAPKIRSLFIANPGQRWLKADYSQQEPRLLLHYANKCKLPGVETAVETFRKNPKTDYHTMTTEIVNRYAQIKRMRKQIKGVNLGIMYSMGLPKLCRMLGVPLSEGEQILRDYHKALPFVKELSKKAMSIVELRGRIRTLLGRVRRFELWEPARRGKDDEYSAYKPLPYDQAVAAWPNMKLQRFGLHKSLNSLIQGSAADQTKKAMAILHYEFGITIQLQVHDELCKSVADIEEARTIKRVMENCVELDVPVVSDAQLGDSWGNAHEEVLLPQ